MKKHLQIASAIGLAAGMVAFKPAVAEGASVSPQDATTEMCKFYKYWKMGKDGSVICYGSNGSECAVC